MRKRIGSLVPIVLSLATLAPLETLAQTNSGLFFDTVDVKVINLEVVVTDRDDRAVTDLTRSDFTVLEDGREVEITNFFVVADGDVVIRKDALGGLDELAPPEPETSRLNLVVYVDNLNIKPENRGLIFDNLRAYLEDHLDTRDRVMLVAANDDVQIEQPFTKDVEALLATLDRLEKKIGRHMQYEVEYRSLMDRMQQAPLVLPGAGSGPENPFGFDLSVLEAKRLAQEVRFVAEHRMSKVRATAEILRSFTATLAGMKGRKAVLYVSDGIPVRAADSLVEAWLGKYEDWILQTGSQELMRELTSLVGLDFDASNELQSAMAEASANRVVFYPISYQGKRARTYLSAEFRGSGSTGGRGPMSLDVVTTENFALEDSLLQLADGTGGVAFTRTANIGKLLDRVVQDFRTFYSIGYVRSPGGEDRAYHEIEVKVRGKGLRVRHLKGFRNKDALDDLQDQTLSALMYDAEENPLEVRLEPGEQIRTGSRRFEVPIMVKVPFRNLLLLPQDEAHSGQVTLFVIARDERGGTSPFQRIEVPIQIPNAQIAAAMTGVAAYPMQLLLNPGRKKISVGVRDQVGRINSTLSLNLKVGEAAETAAEPADAAFLPTEPVEQTEPL